MQPAVVSYQGEPRAVVAELPYLGLTVRSLVGLPRRAYADGEAHLAPPLLDPFVDARATEVLPTPAAMAAARSREGGNWLAQTRRAQQALLAWFLLAEDRQRRLVVRDVAPLMHQLSLVEHVLAGPDLQRVLIGDEVGLGKTVEAGLIAQRLLATRPDVRMLYLAPARLVRNVVGELRRLGLDARRWVAGPESDARIESDRIVVASLQKAVRDTNAAKLAAAGPWDVLIADECHHLSDWEPGGGSPNAGYRLVRDLLQLQRPETGRLLLLSGTPHQGHQARFENILALLQRGGEDIDRVAGRLIYRTKESVRDWYGRPLFPSRDVRQPTVVQLGGPWAAWYDQIGALYDGASLAGRGQAGARAGGWAKGQALQWAASSVEAGLGFLARLAIRRLRWGPNNPALAEALLALRPYRGGAANEALTNLHARMVKQIAVQEDEEDAEELDEGGEARWRPDPDLLSELLRRGAALKAARADAAKWQAMLEILNRAGDEKVVLFCQPVETVAVVAREIEGRFGERPSVIIGGQTDGERDAEVEQFRARRGRRFLVSSRAGGEGINLQVARRLVHLDVPWNPMDLEQRVGRVHRFGSRQTIIVDTVVVAGTREADAYRIAREKLRLIAGQLDPEQFEPLFSRVMSLVPPEELADVFGVDLPWPPGGETERRIASIVRAGYDRWSEFTRRFAEGAAAVAALDPGAVDWADLREFLKRACGAEDGPIATKPVFSIEGRDVVACDAEVRTVRAFEQLFVCDETDGLPAADDEGTALPRLGTGHARVVAEVRERLKEKPEGRIASVRLRAGSMLGLSAPGNAALLFFAVQRVEMSGGTAEERDLRLRAFLIGQSGDPVEVAEGQIGAVVRHVCSAERQATPSGLPERLEQVEAALMERIRQEAMQDHAAPPLLAVWPIACVLAAVVG
ncbi:helicase-related protein [Belnapia rosea]|uniref:SNF2 family N-terminal domain-containing protein n=1 Tax=Belnapia rosea TaxID=938405 RepID=A0A1G7AW18_9PROT|nr:DEAD/DEAH box helicase [Belnapia rosea]SDE18146.1 SNF2 family N-terminal domain-containing protein [Belnapia rosea]